MALSGGVVRRSSDLIAAGVRPQTIADALEAGVVARAGTGAYHLASDAPEPWAAAIAVACVRMPKAVVCLTSAAYLAGLRDAPSEICWLALPIQIHAPKLEGFRNRVLRWSFKGALDLGIVEDVVCGVPIRRTSSARTVVDLVRYAKHLHCADESIEAAKRLVAQGGNPDDILEIAHTLRTPKVAMHTIEIIVRALREARR